ncbi:response regulator [uncultured Aquitalea sp.]|uniref:EAL domain-containing response regulator n=1 Tax=uncultured Aquitalea sp. TaxID=540272 RepID=UPI0025D303F0|nr:response regulator [uncultured Aquitalea sp.]
MATPPMKLLILEDQVVLRKLISRQTGFFSRYPTDIDEFSDAAEALRSVAEHRYDLIITDIGMPGMSGIDFIKNLSAMGCNASLLIVSGYDVKILEVIASMGRAQGLPAVHFLTKPYSMDAFLDKLNQVFSEMEQRAALQGLDQGKFWDALNSANTLLHFQPVRDRANRQTRGYQLRFLQLPDGGQHVALTPELLRSLSDNPQLPALITETLLERVANWVASLPEESRAGKRFYFEIGSEALACENLFDRFAMQLRQLRLPNQQFGFLVGHGLQEGRSPVGFENIAKLKYIGFPLLAHKLEEGAFTLANLLRLPFDGVHLSCRALRLLADTGLGGPSPLGFLLNLGIPVSRLTVTGIDHEADMAWLEGVGDISLQGEQIAPLLSKQAIMADITSATEAKGASA